MTSAQWRDTAIAFVRDLRIAGHLAPIKVGSPSGGRSPLYALERGKEVIAATDSNLIFTWQAYWDRDPGGWEYATDDGFPSATPGALACADALQASGLCWLVGLDGRDDIGLTPYLALAERLQQHRIGWQWWAMFVGDAYGNGLTDNALTSVPKAPFGQSVKELLTAQATLPAL